ncbi:hypothetical protein [Cupriavidus sp. D39]|uniref:hypothetical protein n=1 Tax=Cupriavidus sp. D39 TaxID=2997877 RepID=UPI00226F7799|nr:hypothetical protein [Cupriavidus sp. D39]MCY0853272.1 hypothetical protein [Cupriavidus sp. D39]
MTNLETFPTAEREAFAHACRRHGFIAADFSVCDSTETQVRLVSVLRPETGALMQYAAGPREFWPAEFEQDLISEIFGSAPD